METIERLDKLARARTILNELRDDFAAEAKREGTNELKELRLKALMTIAQRQIKEAVNEITGQSTK